MKKQQQERSARIRSILTGGFGFCLAMMSSVAIAQISTSGTTTISPGSTGSIVGGAAEGSVHVGDFGPGTGAGTLEIDGSGGPNTLVVNPFTVPVVNPDGVSFDGARVHVGLAGVGTLTMTNGALLQINGGASLDGSGLAISNRPGDLDHGLSAPGTMTIDNSRVELTGNDSAGATVGRDGTGILTIQNGGSLEVFNGGGPGSYGVSVGYGTTLSNAPGTGTMTVTGTNSELRAVNLSVGRDPLGLGVLNVEDNGHVIAVQGIRIGRDGGDGELNISSGGLVSSGLGSGNIFLGGNFTGIGGATAELNMSGGTLNAGTGSLFVAHGDSTTATADITGGTVNAPSIVVGSGELTDGTMNVSGASTQINILGLRSTGDGAALVVGRDGLGELNVTGGTVTLDSQIAATGNVGGLVVGGSITALTNDGDGTLNVSGGGTVELRTGVTQIGRQGTGAMNVTAGGTVDASLQEISAVGRLAGSTGTVNVTGAGSTWNAGTNLFIGTDVDFGTATALGNGGTGLVNVASGGALTAGSIYVGDTGTLSGGGGTITANLTLEGGTLAPGNSPGLMQIVGNLDLGVSSITLIELGGLVAGSTYDLIDVTDNLATGSVEGVATLLAGAIFDIDYFGAFTASFGNAFDVLVADDIVVADLSLVSFLLPALTGGLAWSQAIVGLDDGREALRLEVVSGEAVPAPATLLLLLPAVFVLAGMRRGQQRPV